MTPMTPPQGAPPKKKMSPIVLIVLLVGGGLGLVCCLGMMAAIAVPNYVRFGQRSKQSEAKSNLKAISVGERGYFADKEAFSESFAEIAFTPMGKNRYLYLVSSAGAAEGIIDADAAVAPDANRAAYLAAIPPELRAEAGVHGTCPADCYVTAIAVGNIDGDSTLDVWSVSTQDRTIDGKPAAAGQPFLHVSDVED